VTEGDSLADADGSHPRAFTELSRSIVRAGGEGGFLEEPSSASRVHRSAGGAQGARHGRAGVPDLSGRVRRRNRHGLIIFFVPRFEVLFAKLRQRGEMPQITEWLLWLSKSIHGYGLLSPRGSPCWRTSFASKS
jgi:general secretion pathway protein F/type IV pilus assembly protein PilC